MIPLSKNPVSMAIIGMGGFAGAHHNAVLKLEADGEAKLLATCDPTPAAFLAQRSEWKFEERGVRVFDDYREMISALEGHVEMLVIPTPIPLHAPMHRVGVEAGLAVYLEKPPTLDPEELEQMIGDQADARFSTKVGFNFIVQPKRQHLKSRIMHGDFGTLREVRFLGAWPRLESYFQRNAWAGRLLTDDGRLLLDSCLGNAMSHYAHNALFWADLTDLYDWAHPVSVRSAMFRAHTIEGPDTLFLEASLEGGVGMRLGMTHACQGSSTTIEEFICDEARVRWSFPSGGEIFWRDGRHEVWEDEPFVGVPENQRAYCEYLRGIRDRPATRLADTRPFVHLNALAYASAREIRNFSDCGVEIDRTPNDAGSFSRTARGLQDALEEFVTEGTWPRNWNPAAGECCVGMEALSEVPPVVREMRQAVPEVI